MKSKWKPWLNRALTFIFLALVAWLFSRKVNQIDFEKVGESLAKIPLWSLAVAMIMTGGSYLIYASYEMLSRRYTHHSLRALKVGSIAFISYAFNFNFGAWVGGLGFRYRLYTRAGLDKVKIAQILAFSTMTNWLGYLLVGGSIFLFFPPDIPDDIQFPAIGIRSIGAIMLAVVSAYMLLCVWKGRKVFEFRGRSLKVPSWRVLLIQLTLASSSWLLMGAILSAIFPPSVPYAHVLSVYLVAGLAGALTHIPAGLGVMEAVFMTMLSDVLSANEILAYVLAFRAIYYFIPLIIAAIAYLIFEWHHGRSKNSSQSLRRMSQSAQGGRH